MNVDKLLSRCRIAPTKTIGGLSPRQRNELAAVFIDVVCKELRSMMDWIDTEWND